MANDISGIMSSAEQAQWNYENYKDKYVDANEELVNSETFMQLLVAEMTNQDPLEPTSNTEFISQLATFSQMQYMRDASAYSMANYASNLVGKTATATKMEGRNLVTKTGVVESVSKNDSTNSYTVKIDGESFDLSKITAVTETVKESENADNLVSAQNAMGDSIARASAMVGMYASVSREENGVTTNDAGFITAIQVKDGVISAVINDRVFALSDITEVTYATIVEEPENPDVQQSVVDESEAEASGAGETVTEIEEDVADLVEESEMTVELNAANAAALTPEEADRELALKLIEALESGADIETVLKIAGEIPEDAVITNPHPTGITPVSAPDSTGIAEAELVNEQAAEETSAAEETAAVSAETTVNETERILAQQILDAMQAGADIDTLLAMVGDTTEKSGV